MSPIALALLTCVVYCTSVNADPTVTKLMGSGEDSGPACTPFIKYSNGTDMALTIGQYLESADFLQCHGEVNRDLITCFTGGSEVGSSLRERLKTSLGNVCGMFVELLSLLARFGHEVDICNNTALTDATLTGDFCQEVVAESPAITATMTTLDALGYTQYSSVVTKLLNLGDECPQRCGHDGGNILCNAYYSLANVLSIVGPQSLEPTQPQNAPEPIADYSEPVPISALLHPMQSLPLTTLQTLLFSSPQHMQKVLSSALEELSSADLHSFLQRPDLVTIVRMFWVVDCVYDRLNAMNSNNLEFSTRHDNLLFQGGMGPEEKGILKEFEDRSTIFKYIYEYRTWLFNGWNRPSQVSTPPIGGGGGGGVYWGTPATTGYYYDWGTPATTGYYYDWDYDWGTPATTGYYYDWGTPATTDYYYTSYYDDYYDRKWRKYDHRRLVLKAVRITFAVLGSLFAAVVAAIIYV